MNMVPAARLSKKAQMKTTGAAFIASRSVTSRHHTDMVYFRRGVINVWSSDAIELQCSDRHHKYMASHRCEFLHVWSCDFLSCGVFADVTFQWFIFGVIYYRPRHVCQCEARKPGALFTPSYLVCSFTVCVTLNWSAPIVSWALIKLKTEWI